MPKNLLLLAALASLPLAGAAQTYVGVGPNLLTGGPFRTNSSSYYGGALTVGRQLTARLALQTGAGYDSRTVNGTATHLYTPTETQTRVLTVPLLVRATATSPDAAFHVDALAGFTYVYSTVSYTRIYSSGSTSSTDLYSTNLYNVALGPGLRYSLTPRLEVTASVLANVVLNGEYATEFSDRLFLNTQLGVQYVFR